MAKGKGQTLEILTQSLGCCWQWDKIFQNDMEFDC